MLSKLALLSAIIVMLAGCSTTKISQYKGPDGSDVMTVKCKSDRQACFAAASHSCPGSGTYRALASDSHAGGFGDDAIPNAWTWYSMTYVCGPSDGRVPTFPFGGATVSMPVFVPKPLENTNCTTLGNTTNCTSR